MHAASVPSPLLLLRHLTSELLRAGDDVVLNGGVIDADLDTRIGSLCAGGLLVNYGLEQGLLRRMNIQSRHLGS